MALKKRPMLVVIAAVLAGGTGLIAFDYLSTARASSAPPPQRPVLVASRPVNAREAITSAMVQVQMRPADAVDPGAYSSTNQVIGDVAQADIPAGAALTSSNVTRASMMPEPFHLSSGMRAMSIAVDEVKDVSGLIQPGDHIDVYAVTPRMGDSPSQAFAILRDIVVLGVGGSVTTSPASPQGQQPTQWRSVTLQVSARQAKVLAIADMNATLRLALRPPGEPLRSEPVDAFAMPHAQSAPMPMPAPVAVQQPPATGAAPPAPKSDPPASHSIGSSVQFILGDHVEDGGANK
ncbi:MAG TPA: Flp pilus assembly protein CpaB [Candidatus Baltobacteraceae bacterium]|nr:Flp pilus assembly protein CpaB [Candidatus Baltobacteraceae bacterium]